MPPFFVALQCVIDFALLGAVICLWGYVRALHRRFRSFDGLMMMVPHMLKIAAKTGSARAAVDDVSTAFEQKID